MTSSEAEFQDIKGHFPRDLCGATVRFNFSIELLSGVSLMPCKKDKIGEDTRPCPPLLLAWLDLLCTSLLFPLPKSYDEYPKEIKYLISKLCSKWSVYTNIRSIHWRFIVAKLRICGVFFLLCFSSWSPFGCMRISDLFILSVCISWGSEETFGTVT